MGLAALSLWAAISLAPPPYPADATLAGSVNGAQFHMVTGTARESVGTLLPKIAAHYKARRGGAVWFSQKGHGLLWQRLGPAVDPADVREAVRASKKLALKMAERDAVFLGPTVFLYDTACALGSVPAEQCNSVGVRELAAILEAVIPVGTWQMVELTENGKGDTAWTWVAFDGVKLSRLLPTDDPVLLAANCRWAPYPLPPGSLCTVVASFAGAAPAGKFVSYRTQAPAAEAKRAVERGLVAAGWTQDGDGLRGATGAHLQVVAQDGRRGANVLLVETP